MRLHSIVAVCHYRVRAISPVPFAFEVLACRASISFRSVLAEVDNILPASRVRSALASISRAASARWSGRKANHAVADDLKLKQLHELLKVHLTRRKVEAGALDFKTPEKAAGNTVRQSIVLRQGVDADLSKRLVREVKDSKMKVQIAIQGTELRVTGKKRDDLQAAIGLLRGLKIEQPLQYVNFRE